MSMSNICTICGSPERAMVYKNELWCSDLCRKLVQEEITPSAYTIFSGNFYNPRTGFYDLKAPAVEDKKKRARASVKRSTATFSGD